MALTRTESEINDRVRNYGYRGYAERRMPKRIASVAADAGKQSDTAFDRGAQP
jgi:hypothetical protein